MHRQGASAIRPVSGVAAGQTAAVPYRFRRSGLGLHTTNPMYLLDFLRCRRHPGDVAALLPVREEAGYLAQGFNNVYLDGGLAINYLGARSAAFIARLLEMAPFRKVLYSSDVIRPGRTALPRSTVVAQRHPRRAAGLRRHDEWSEPMRSGSST